MTPRADDHRFTRVAMWMERRDADQLLDAVTHDLVPSVREVRVTHNQALPNDTEERA